MAIASLPLAALLSALPAHLPATLAEVLIASAWQGLALTLSGVLALRLLPPLGPSMRSLLWTGVLALAVLLPVLLLLPRSANQGGHGALLHVHQNASVSSDSFLVPALLTLWLAASAFRFAQLALSAAHLRRLLRRAASVAIPADLAALLVHRGRPVLLCASADIDRPSVAGFLQPRILLPTALLDTASAPDLRHIVLHECEHLRRGDHWVNLLGQFALAVFPLSPALLWLNRRLALERELACDDQVLLSNGGARRAYAACLARVAEGSLAHRGLQLAIGILGGRKHRPELSYRVERILHGTSPTVSRRGARFAAAALCALLASGSALLAHSPELVSFVPSTSSLSGSGPSPAASRVAAAFSSSTAQWAAPLVSAAPHLSLVVDRLPSGLGIAGHGAVTSQLTFVKAVMPQPVARTCISRAGASARHATLRRSSRVRVSAAPRITLTSFSEEESSPLHPQLHLVPVFLPEAPGLWTAVPAWITTLSVDGTPTSWVVVQI